MLAATFRSNQPAVLLAVPLVSGALFVPAFWHAPAMADGLMPLAQLVQSLLGQAPWAHALVGWFLTTTVAVQLAVLFNALELYDRRNHLPGLLLPITLAGIGGPGAYDPALLGMPFALLALRRAWSINNTGPALSPLFDASLLIGLAALCYLPYAFLLVVIWSSASLLRPFAWREYVIPTVGLAFVFYLAWAALQLMLRTPWRPLPTVMAPDQLPAVIMNGAAHRVFLVLLIPQLLLAFAAFNRSHAQSVMRGKNLRSSFMAFAMALVLLMAMLSLLRGGFPAVLAAVPAAALLGYLHLDPRRGWLSEAAVLGLAVVAMWVRWA